MDGKWEMEKKGKVSFGLGCGLEASLSAAGLCFLGKLLYFFLDFPTFPLAPPAPVVVAAFFMMFAHSLLVPPRFWVTKPKSQQSGPGNEKAEIPFACFIGVAFLLSEHQMGFVCRSPNRRTYVSVSVPMYLLSVYVFVSVCDFLLRNSSMVC